MRNHTRMLAIAALFPVFGCSGCITAGFTASAGLSIDTDGRVGFVVKGSAGVGANTGETSGIPFMQPELILVLLTDPATFQAMFRSNISFVDFYPDSGMGWRVSIGGFVGGELGEEARFIVGGGPELAILTVVDKSYTVSDCEHFCLSWTEKYEFLSTGTEIGVLFSPDHATQVDVSGGVEWWYMTH